MVKLLGRQWCGLEVDNCTLLLKSHYLKLQSWSFKCSPALLRISCWAAWMAMNLCRKVTFSGTTLMPINLPIRNPIYPPSFEVLLALSLAKNGCCAFLFNAHLKLHKRFHLVTFLPTATYDIFFQLCNHFSPCPAVTMLGCWDLWQLEKLC